MTEMRNNRPRIGYVNGKPKRVNERVVDGQWVQYLSEYAELVEISPFQIYKLFGGTIPQWIRRLPESLDELSIGLRELVERDGIRTLYLNLPSVTPYLLMARDYAGLDLGLLLIAHSVGSEFWIKQWLAVAPWLSKRDVLLVSTRSANKALTLISERYSWTTEVPLCIDVPEILPTSLEERTGKRLLSIGRIEDVKNIDLLLEAFAVLKKRMPELTLTVAGEYTGNSKEQADDYKQRLESIILDLNLQDSVHFPGAVTGQAKEELFRQSDLLMNLSTDPGETFGYNLIEAKRWGLPVLCANWDGFQEILESGSDGLFIDCDWAGDLPELDKQQIVERATTLLSAPDQRADYSDSSLRNVRKFDYRTIMPVIISAVQEAEQVKLTKQPDAVRIATSPIVELDDFFHLPNLKQFPFLSGRLINLDLTMNVTPLREWMPLAKPIIAHFAGRSSYAYL